MVNKNTFSKYWSEAFEHLRIRDLDTRYVPPTLLARVLENLPSTVSVLEVGKSAEDRSILKLQIGTGSKVVLAWANMHGNETTSLRGWMDVLQNLEHPEIASYFKGILNEYTIHFIPQLNPDGALRYTRRNGQQIDMNRDARALQSPEMQLLNNLIDRLSPILAFNLHDQRNIFAVNGKPATLSFLAPSINIERSITAERRLTMDLIGAAANDVESVIGAHIGRYTDAYYPTAIGEYVQQKGISTILVECGSSLSDELRQKARMANAIVLHSVLSRLRANVKPDNERYLIIPLNETNQVDVLIKDLELYVGKRLVKADLALLAEEKVENGEYSRVFKVQDFGDLRSHVALHTCVWKSTERAGNYSPASNADFVFDTDKGKLEFKNGSWLK